VILNKDDIVEITTLIEKDLQIDNSELVECNAFEAFKKRLTEIISYLLDKDFERLLSAMYRIDISEEKFKTALSINPASEIAPSIAALIIEREMQKVITRRKYSSK